MTRGSSQPISSRSAPNYYENALGRRRHTFTSLNPGDYDLNDPRNLTTNNETPSADLDWVEVDIPVEAYDTTRTPVPTDFDMDGNPISTFLPEYFSVLPGWYFESEFKSRVLGPGAEGDVSDQLPPWHDIFSHLLMPGDERSNIDDAFNLTDVVDYVINQTTLEGNDTPQTRTRILGDLTSGRAHSSLVDPIDRGPGWSPDQVTPEVVQFVYDQLEHNYQINRDAGLTGIGGVGGFIADLAQNPTSFWFQRPTHVPIVPGNDGSQVDARPR